MTTKGATLVCVLLLCGVWSAQAANDNVEQLLLQAFKAERGSPTSAKTMEKFDDVLKADPDNYYALIKIGLVKMGDPARYVDAVDYFLRAALAKPDHPEAYQYLAQLYYKMGYMNEGDTYLNMSRSLGRLNVYNSIILMGWRYEDTGNYSAAVRTYATPALSANSEYRGNPYLMKRLYESVLASSEPYDWSESVFKLMEGQKEGDIVIRSLRSGAEQVAADVSLATSARNPSKIVNQRLRSTIVDELRSFVANLERVPDRPELPTSVYRFFFCNPDAVQIKAVSDPYEAFADASTDSNQEQKRVLQGLHQLRDEALKEIAREGSEKDKAAKLFAFLKRRALAEYDALEGYSAKGIVDNKKFISLDGTILYLLIARDAKLNVSAYMEPGHAYPVLNLGRNQRIRIELTAEANEGFDFKPDANAKYVPNDKGLREGPFQTLGEVSDPLKLIARQYGATADYNLYKFILSTKEPLFRQAMKSEFDLDYSRQTDIIAELKSAGIAGNEMGNFWLLVRAMAVSDDAFRGELMNRFDRSIALLKKAEALDPFNRGVRDQSYSLIVQAAAYESLPAETAVAERLQRRLVGLPVAALKQQGVSAFAQIDAAAGAPEAVQMLEEERERWALEKKYWIKAIERIAAAVRADPCDEKLRGLLAVMRDRVLSFADKFEDVVASDELRMITAGLSR